MITVINFIANLTLTVGVMFFLVGVFGRRSAKVEAMSFVERLLVKAALASTAAGGLLNCLTLSTPGPTEVLLNVGLGLLFVWAAMFHWRYFVRPKV